MHAFLGAVGFSELKNKRDLDVILQDVLENYDIKKM